VVQEETASNRGSMSAMKVHRWRFSDWQPSAVVSIACSPSLPATLVAVGREDGSIAVCDANHRLAARIHVAGVKDLYLQQLCWGHLEERLFGISLRGFVFEVRILSSYVSPSDSSVNHM